MRFAIDLGVPRQLPLATHPDRRAHEPQPRRHHPEQTALYGVLTCLVSSDHRFLEDGLFRARC